MIFDTIDRWVLQWTGGGCFY